MIDQKIQNAIEKIKALKAEKEELERRVRSLEEIIKTKNQKLKISLLKRIGKEKGRGVIKRA